MLGPYHAVTAASRMNLITLPELRALCFQRRRQRPRSEGIERLMITIAHRWEEQQFLVKSSGFHLKFMQALLRIRWESDGTNLKYNIRGYIRAMQWRLLVGVAHALISKMLNHRDDEKKMSPRTREGLRRLSRKMPLIGSQYAMQMSQITSLIREKIKGLQQEEGSLPRTTMRFSVPVGQLGLHRNVPNTELKKFLAMFPESLLCLKVYKQSTVSQSLLCLQEYKECQSRDWKDGGHSDHCTSLAKYSKYLNELEKNLEDKLEMTWGDMLSRDFLDHYELCLYSC